MTNEQRRQRIAALLQEASDRKLLLGETAVARERLLAARALCEGVPLPWPALVAYRLAHLEMRTAIQKTQFDEAEGLFLEAAKSRALGPWPRVFRLAAMSRAGATPGLLQAEFRRAVTAVEEWRASRGDAGSYDPRLQDEAHNLLELSAYLLGLPTEALDGHGAISTGADDWILVGPDAVTATIRYPRELALEELEARARTESNAVIYRLSEDGRNGAWCLPGGDRKWEEPRQDLLRLLALLQARRLRKDELPEKVARSGTAAAFAQVKKRLCDALGLGPQELWDEDARTGLLQPGPRVLAFGAVSLKGLEAPTMER